MRSPPTFLAKSPMIEKLATTFEPLGLSGSEAERALML